MAIVRCIDCKAFYDEDALLPSVPLEHCPVCGGILREIEPE